MRAITQQIGRGCSFQKLIHLKPFFIYSKSRMMPLSSFTLSLFEFVVYMLDARVTIRTLLFLPQLSISWNIRLMKMTMVMLGSM